MDFGELLHTAQKNEKHKSTGSTGGNYYKARFDPPKKEEKQKTLSANIQKFLAKKEEEERRKAEEEIRKRDELLAMRDPKDTRKIQKMLKVIKSANKSVLNDAIDTEHTAITRDGPMQPDQDDYGYESQEAAAIYKKMMEKYSKMPVEEKFPPSASGAKGDLLGTRDRVRAALLRQQEEDSGPHRRQRKAHKSQEAIDTPDNYEPEKKVEKAPEKKNKKPPPPVMDFNELLRIAEEKKSQPVLGVAAPKPVLATEPERLMTKRQRREYEEECARRDARLRRQQQRAQHEADRKEEKHGSESKPPPKSTFNRIPKLSQKGNTNNTPDRNGYTENHQLQPSMTSATVKSSRPDRPNVSSNHERTSTSESFRDNGRPNSSSSSRDNSKSHIGSSSRENDRTSISNKSRENQRSYSPGSMRENNRPSISNSHRDNYRSNDNGRSSNSNSSRENKNPSDKDKSNGSYNSSEAKVKHKDHRDISSEKSRQPSKDANAKYKSDKLREELTKPRTNGHFNRDEQLNLKKDNSKEPARNSKSESSQHRKSDIPREKDFNPFRNNNNRSNENKIPVTSRSSDGGKSNTADRLGSRGNQEAINRKTESNSKFNGHQSSTKPTTDNNPFRTKQISDMKSKNMNSSLDKSRPMSSSDAKARHSLLSDTRPKQQSNATPKPSSEIRPKPGLDGKSRQFPPSDIRSRQFPPADVQPRQFPPKDTRRFPPQDMRKKDRPALKRRVIGSESEYDSELEDFIDDGPEENQDYSKYIKEIFGYDRNKYRDLDEDDANMESTFAQQMREEYISKKIGIQEDLEDMRMEAMEKKSKQKRRRIDDDDDD